MKHSGYAAWWLVLDWKPEVKMLGEIWKIW